jgi:hypothetical protein
MRDYIEVPPNPAAAVRRMLVTLVEQERLAQEVVTRAQERVQFAVDEAAQAQADLDAMRAVIVEWREFQRMVCE